MGVGQVIFLNGTSSAGKTSIAKALQDKMDEPYLHTGVDHFLERIPKNLLHFSDGSPSKKADGWTLTFRNGAYTSAPKIGPTGYLLLNGMYRAIAAFVEVGNNVIVDDVIYDKRVLYSAVTALWEFPVLFVGLHCPIEVLVRREQERGDRGSGNATMTFREVHAHSCYDIELDTSLYTPVECARRIKSFMKEGHSHNAFRHLHKTLTPV